ncbi:MAG: glycosyltransferase family 2 protein [Bacteroidota bacterium]
MLVSILVPVHNAAFYLSECLDSLLQQGETAWELLAVNDFSTDKSWQILQKYAAKDERIKIFQNTQKGIIPALRLAFEKSKGELITRMDADDRMAVDKLALLKAALVNKGKGHLATNLVEYFSEQPLGEGYKKYAAWLNALTLAERNFEEIYKECVIPSPSWMMYRTDLQACGAFDTNRYPEDYDLCFRWYAQQLKVIGVPEILHFWRDHSTRTSRNDPTYADNRFLDLKIEYFLRLDHQKDKNLVLWGAGKKGKAIAKLLAAQKIPFRWICNQASKWGHRIHGVELESTNNLIHISNPQVIVAVANAEAQQEIRKFFQENGISKQDFFFFC